MNYDDRSKKLAELEAHFTLLNRRAGGLTAELKELAYTEDINREDLDLAITRAAVVAGTAECAALQRALDDFIVNKIVKEAP